MPNLYYVDKRYDRTSPNRLHYQILKGFARSGWNTEFVTTSSYAQKVPTLWDQVPVHFIAGRNALERTLRVARYLAKTPPESFALTWVWDRHNVPFALTKPFHKKPYGVLLDTFLFQHSDQARQRLREEVFYGATLRNADLIIAEVPAAVDRIKKHLHREAFFMPPSFWQSDLEQQEAAWQAEGYAPEREPVILYAGRMIPRKNIHDLIAAFAQLADKHPDWLLEIRGPADNDAYVKQLQDQIQALDSKIASRVQILPPLWEDQLTRRLRETAIWALPSTGEGYPSAVLEAMIHGGAMLVAPSGFVGFIVGQGDSDLCALLHQPGDTAQIASGLDQLMASAREREALQSRARSRAHRLFTWEQYYPALETALRSFLPQH